MQNFGAAPFLAIWEITQACDLACAHGRASAVPWQHPLELSTEEDFRLLEDVKSFGNPLMVFTGGDPLKRPDLFALLEKSVQLGLRTTVTRHNRLRLPEIAEIVERSGARLWSVFFLVTTGRALVQDDLTADDYGRVFAFLYNLSKRVSFDIKTTEAQHYRRFVAQQRKMEKTAPRAPVPNAVARHAGINDGKGLLFISHTGEIYPSGFLPISAGNVRCDSLLDVYRHSSLFRELRNSDNLKGKCGRCEYRNLCGGSRSRAYGLTGDYLAEEQRCVVAPSEIRAKIA